MLAAWLHIDARDVDTYDTDVLMTARAFVGNLLAPAWPIGLVAAGVGFALWLWGVVVLVPGRNEAPTES